MLHLEPFSKVRFREACAIEEYYLLFGIMALLRPQTILEIGTSTGLGTCALWSGASVHGHRPKITTIEWKPRLADVQSNFAGLGVDLSTCNIEFLKGDSRVLVPKLHAEGKKFDLCFIDGCHQYEYAKADWINTQGMTGFWIFHDSTQMPGVRRLVSEIRRAKKWDVFGFDRYPFCHQFHTKQGGLFVKKTIPGISLVTRKGVPYPVGAGEIGFLRAVGYAE